MKKRITAVFMSVLLVLTLFSPLSAQEVSAAAAPDLNEYADVNGEYIRKQALYAYFQDKDSFYIYDSFLRFASARRGVTNANPDDLIQEINNALNYLGRKYPAFSTPIFDRIEWPAPGTGQTSFYFTLRKDPEAGGPVLDQAGAKQYLNEYTSKNKNPKFDDKYSLLDEIKAYSEAEYAALQVKAYEFFLSYAKKCNNSTPQNYLISQEVKIPFSDIFNTFFDETAFTQIFYEYLNFDSSTQEYIYRDALLKEIYEALWYLCHASAFWLDRGACNNAKDTTPGSSGVSYSASDDVLTVNFTVSAVRETTSHKTTSSELQNANYIRDNYLNETFFDPFGYTFTFKTPVSYKSIAKMATEFDDRVHQILNSVYREELSVYANEYAVFKFLQGYLNYGNLEGDDTLNDAVVKPDVHIPFDLWNKYIPGMDLINNYSYVYTAIMNGNGICDAQVKAAQTLLMYIGVKSTIAVGDGHVWNMVYFDGQQYVLDVGPHRPYPIFNIGASFAKANYTTDTELRSYNLLGDAFKNLNNMYGSTGPAHLATVQDGEYVYYIDFTDNCNVYKVRIDGSSAPQKVYTAPGTNTVAAMDKYITTNNGTTHSEIMTDTNIINAWNTNFVKDRSTPDYSTIISEMSQRSHTHQQAWFYRVSAALYYANLAIDGKNIILNLKYTSSTGELKEHHKVLKYSLPKPVTSLQNSTPYTDRSSDRTIRSTNTYSVGSLVKGGLINGTVSAPSNDTMEKVNLYHNDVLVYSHKSESRPGGIGLGTILRTDDTMTYGENVRYVLGKSRVFNAVSIHAFTTKKSKAVIAAKPVNTILSVGSIDYNITNMSASATGGYCLNIDAYNNDTGKTSKYAISWNGKLPEKAGSINTICHFNKTSRLLSIVLENGEFQSIYIDSNGGLKCTGKMHLYGTNEIHIFSKDDWNAYAAFVNNGYFNTGFKVIIDRKLDFKGQNVTPLGTAKNPFRNEFEGNGLEIGNGKIVTTESSVGLFGYADNAKINNFTVYSLKIDAGDKVGIIGNLVNSTASNIRVTDCPIKGKTGVGTVGYASNATITGVFVTDRMSVSGNENVGGVCGYTNKDVTIKNCWNAADISGNSNIGGIVGTSIYTGRERSHETYVFGCFNAGSVTAKKQNVGGIAGCFYDILFMRCQSFGKAVIK